MGVRERLERIGRRVIRDYMTAQIREFYRNLPFLVIGAVDRRDRPWATFLWGEPGFVRTPNERTVVLTCRPGSADPLHGALRPGSPVSILGIEFDSRRRNTTNGRIEAADPSELRIRVERSFGNCPRHIRRRSIMTGNAIAGEGPGGVQRSTNLDSGQRQEIRGADGFFMATNFPESAGDPVHGVDVAWRGGMPGFVQVRDERTIEWPEFAGNNHFNTLGNLSVNERAGVLFPSFATGALLYLTGRASTQWDGDTARNLSGGRHVVTLEADEVIQVWGSFPILWRLEESSNLDDTGAGNGVAATTAAHSPGVGRAERAGDGPEVVFLRSNLRGRWSQSFRSLLDMAEAYGLQPAYGCRSGMCGGCAVALVQGAVEYPRRTLAEPAPGEVLICKAVPAQQEDGSAMPVVRRIVLDL